MKYKYFKAGNQQLYATQRFLKNISVNPISHTNNEITGIIKY